MLLLSPLLLTLPVGCPAGATLEDPFPDDSGTPETSDADTDTDADSDSDTDSDTDTDTADTGDTGTAPESFDCSLDLPRTYTPGDTVPNAKGYHGLAFLDDGRLIGSDNNALIEVDSEGQWGIFKPGLGYLEQLAVLPDGSLAISSRQTGDLLHLTLDGGSELIYANLNTYGVTVGPDGMLYTAWRQGIARIDPETGNLTPLIDSFSGFATPRIVGFSPDLKRIYTTTIGNGTVYVADLDADLNVVGDPRTFATGVGGGWHDSLALDICGNLYVADYESTALWRVTHDGEVQKIWAPNQYTQYGHGAEWGTGEHGWNGTSLFLPQPYNNNTVTEIDIGIPPWNWEGEVLNAPYDAVDTDETDTE
jgi:hypothetical protein